MPLWPTSGIISFKVYFICWCFISKWKKKTVLIINFPPFLLLLFFSQLNILFAILLLHGITSNLTDLIKNVGKKDCDFHINSFKKVWHKNYAILYFLSTSQEHSAYVLSFVPSVMVVTSISVPSFFPCHVQMCLFLYWNEMAKQYFNFFKSFYIIKLIKHLKFLTGKKSLQTMAIW